MKCHTMCQQQQQQNGPLTGIKRPFANQTFSSSTKEDNLKDSELGYDL